HRLRGEALGGTRAAGALPWAAPRARTAPDDARAGEAA
ncbi:hypothetical protein GA0115251_12601, partial [Streptomyces sp. TverLS-915]